MKNPGRRFNQKLIGFKVFQAATKINVPLRPIYTSGFRGRFIKLVRFVKQLVFLYQTFKLIAKSDLRGKKHQGSFTHLISEADFTLS